MLRDIAHHIRMAVQFASGFNEETFRADLRTVYAVTRCLEMIPFSETRNYVQRVLENVAIYRAKRGEAGLFADSWLRLWAKR